jgi:cystathionine gamma-synthase
MSSPPAEEDELSADQTTYLEERYGRNLPQCSAAQAKRALRRRIAGVLVGDTCASPTLRSLASSPEPCITGSDNAELEPSTRGVETVTEDDVFLFPTGMTAIWSAHQLAMKVLPLAKSVCFGFPYTDTLKILQKWGPGCHFFGHGLDSDVNALEQLLESAVAAEPSSPPLLALFCEFPSNPLLRSPNLPRLRALADKYNFMIVVDETVGNFLNVSVLPYTDIVVSSLTKVFSGDSNVMGGRYAQQIRDEMVIECG